MRPNPVVAAAWLRRRYGLQLPVRAVDVARRIGIDVEFELLSPDISGCLIQEGDGRYLIILNRRESPERQQWTCAHEIGHWALHRYMRRQFVCGPRVSDLWEREANAFAAELLMPREVVAKAARRMAFTSLAAYFGVSLMAMHLRLEEVGVECA